MANHKSALKRARQNENRRVRNRAGRSAMRAELKKFDTAAETDGNAAAALLSHTVSTLAGAGKKGLIPKQRASRKIARLSKRVAKLS